MANAGLSIGNPALLGLGIGSIASEIPSIGLDARTNTAIEQEKARIMEGLRKEPATKASTNSVYRSADGKRYAVGGYAFGTDDYATAIDTEKFIGQAFTPQEAGWEPVDEGSYRQFLERIKNPTTSELFGRNVDIGVANGKQLLGSLAQFLGAEEFGAGVVKSAGQDIAKLEPFQRGLGSIKSAEDMGAFVVANLGQQVPNLIASLVSAGTGVIVGGSLAAGRGALVRELGVRLSSKEGQDALRTTLTRATQKHLAGEALDKTEQEALKFAGRAGGAAIGAAVQNYTMGVADIYGETQEQGADTVRGRMAAILGGIPYAALETLPELAYAKALAGGGVGKTALKDITGGKGKAGELLKRGGKGAAKGAGLEAVTEAGQEVTSLLSASAALGFNGKPLTSNENLLRIAEAAAAGAAVGGVLGGVSNLRGPREAMSSGEPVNLITDVPKEEEPAPTVFMGLKLPEGLVPASASIALNRPVWEQGPPVAGPNMPRGVSPVRGVELPPNRPAWVDNLPPELRSTYSPLVPVAGLQVGGGLAPYTGQPEGLDITGVEFNFGQPALPAPAAPAAPMAPLQLLGTPDFVAGPQGMRPAEAGDVLFGVQGNVPPGTQAGSQGLLDIFGGQPVTAEELAARMMPSTAIPMGAPPVEPVRNPQQGALQFAPAAPESWGRGESTQMRRGLEQLIARGRNAPLFAEQEAARAAAEEAARQAQRDADYQAALNQVELQLAENLPNVAGPVAPAVIPTPQPVPTGAKGAKLKRGKSQEQAGKREDTEGRGRLAVKREDRNKPAEDQKAGGAPSGGRGAEQGAEKGKGLKKPKPAPKAEAKPKPAAKPRAMPVDALVRGGQMITAGKRWAEFSDVRWNTLTPEQQERWRKAVIEDGNPSMALAEEIAPTPKPAPTPAAPAGAMGFVAKPKPAGKTKLATAKETVAVKKPEVVIDSSEPVVQTTPVTTPVSGYELVKQTLKEAKSAKEEKKPTEAQVRYAAGLAERIEEKAKDFKPREAIERASYEQETLTFVAAINASSGLDAQNGDAEWAKEVTKRGVFDQLNLSKIKNVPTGWLSIAEVEKLEKAGRKRGKGAGNYKRVSDNTDAAPIGIGRVKMLVSQFVSKLKMKPTVYVYADINDLKVQNPELYRRAKAARVEGDFDNTLASGYSFGKNIIIFSNNIFSADHLNFVMAHETIGHFGMRSLMSGRDFDALMNEVYESSGGIRNAVDAAMASSDMSKSEAVEEYLADFAGTLNNNLLARVWAAIKNALNKLGVKFSDDMARYLISQSRRYVYEGKTGNTFVNSAVALRMMSVESGEDTIELGRYSGKPNLRDDNLQAALMANYTSDAQGMNYDQLSDFIRRAKAAGMDFGNSFEKFKEKFFSLLNFRTRENPGLSALHDVLSAGRDMAMSIKVLMNERMAVVLNRSFERLPFLGGITEEELNQVNRMLYEGQRYAISKYKSSAMGKTPLFYVDDEGQVKLNPTEAKRLTDLGMLKFEQMRDGFSYNVTYLKEGKEVTEKINVDGVPGLTTDSPIWKGYEATRESMADVELKLLQARYTSFIQESKNAYRSIAKAMRDATLTSADNAFLEKMYNTYKALWISNPTVDKDGDEAYSEESMAKANDFLAKMNELIIANESDKNVQLKDVLAGTAFDKQYDDLIASLTEFKQRFAKTKDREFLVQNKLKEVLVAELSNLGGDKYTKTSLATGYLPLLRKGDYQVRVVAYDKEGNPVRLKPEYVNQLSYTQHETESDALEMADLINNRLFKEDGKKKYYELEVFDENTGNYKSQNVELRADVGAVLNSIAAPPSLNLNEFIHGLRRFSIVLTPNKMEQVIVALTKQDNKARKRLQRSFVPGADMDGVAAVSQHIDSRASTIAKVAMRPQLNALMDRSLPSTMDIWKAEEKVDGVPKLKYLKDQWDRLSKTPDATPEQVTAAKRAYYEYKYMVDKTKPEGRASRDNMYYSEASRLLTFLDSNKSLDESDFGAGKVVSSIRAYTSMMQLGGSLATGALNYIGLFTNSFPYLATYNEKTAFGEGFGYGNAVAEFSKASGHVGLARAIGNSEFNTSLFYDKIAGDGRLQKQYGLTEAEAKFIAQEIREGVMIPAQSNALANTARGRITSGAGQKLMDAWMWTFNSTEQAARRSLGLATFRLAYNRAIASKMSEAQAIEQARKSAVDAIRYTMGEYSVINRPPAWRSGLQSFLYMYKVYPTTTIQTLARLSRTGQIQMLAGMWLLSGLAGMPFAEDFEDLLDTIAQKLGLSMGSVRFELAKLLDSIAPGVSPYLLKGVFNSLSPADIASRVSTGDFIPGTEILLAGADVGQQVKEILGPAASAMIGAATSMGAALSAATTEKTSIADVFREAPVTMMRAMGDAYVYAQTGTVLDKKGYVVTPDVSMMTILARMGGFYPASASEAYETIKLTNRVTDYQREVSGSYKRAWVKAMIGKDPEQARRVEEAVREWNVGAKGTGLEIRDFVANARRALKEAERPAKERSLRAVGKAAQATIEELDTLLSYPTSQP